MTIDPEGPAFGPADTDTRAVDGLPARPATIFRVALSAGIWQVTKDGCFYGHYMDGQPAFDAAEAAARATVASGGTADVLWNDRQTAVAGRGQDSNIVPFAIMRTMQFRAGSTRIVP